MRNLFFLPLAVLLTGCIGSQDSFKYLATGNADSYTCETAGENAQAYYDTGEHPNLLECL
ncbi:hypothetical protein [Prochlorococcus marinus]|uniref:hypothetical protein n=1 Tax=Prochlorococcus marinus TaxID=1219 RepID=UPI000565F582|nr:hypothetical protein [Prochlorococcus marinus]